MPVWSDQANPPGPLNYRQIDELIAFLRATNDHVYVVKDPSLNEPIIDPDDRRGDDVHGLAGSELQARPGRDAVSRPAISTRSAAAPAASGAPGASIDPSAPVVTVTAPTAPRRRGLRARRRSRPRPTSAFTLEFDNQDATAPHNIVIKDPGGAGRPDRRHDASSLGPETRTYAVPPLAAGDYASCARFTRRR